MTSRTYTDIDSFPGGTQLRFSANGPLVRVTLLETDTFDADFDREQIIGDFNLDVLRHRLAGLGATHPEPLAPAEAEAGEGQSWLRRLADWWWER